MCRSVCFILIRPTYQARAKLLRSASRDRTREMIFRFTLSCHAIAFRLAVASCEGWLASAEAFTNGGSSARQSWPDSYFLIGTFYF